MRGFVNACSLYSLRCCAGVLVWGAGLRRVCRLGPRVVRWLRGLGFRQRQSQLVGQVGVQRGFKKADQIVTGRALRK